MFMIFNYTITLLIIFRLATTLTLTGFTHCKFNWFHILNLLYCICIILHQFRFSSIFDIILFILIIKFFWFKLIDHVYFFKLMRIFSVKFIYLCVSFSHSSSIFYIVVFWKNAMETFTFLIKFHATIKLVHFLKIFILINYYNLFQSF